MQNILIDIQISSGFILILYYSLQHKKIKNKEQIDIGKIRISIASRTQRKKLLPQWIKKEKFNKNK